MLKAAWQKKPLGFAGLGCRRARWGRFVRPAPWLARWPVAFQAKGIAHDLGGALQGHQVVLIQVGRKGPSPEAVLGGCVDARGEFAQVDGPAAAH